MKKLMMVLLFLFILIVSGCAQKDPEIMSYAVTFDSNGGSSIASQTVDDGMIVSEPEHPTRDGYVFEFWYRSGETSPFDFSSLIYADTTLIAQWRAINIEDIYQRMQDLSDSNQIHLTISQYAIYTDLDEIYTDFTYEYYYQIDPYYFYIPISDENRYGSISVNDGTDVLIAALYPSIYNDEEIFAIFDGSSIDLSLNPTDAFSGFIDLFDNESVVKVDDYSFIATISGDKIESLDTFGLNDFITHYFDWEYWDGVYDDASVDVTYRLTDEGYEVDFELEVLFNDENLQAKINLVVLPSEFELIDVFSESDTYVPIQVSDYLRAFPISLDQVVQLPDLYFDVTTHLIYLESGAYQLVNLGDDPLRLIGVGNGTIDNTAFAFSFVDGLVEPHTSGYYIPYDPLQQTFYIREAGYYYIGVGDNMYSTEAYDYQFKITSLDYETLIIDDARTIDEGTFAIELEGLYDGQMFIYDGSESMTIEVSTDLSDVFIYVYDDSDMYWRTYYARYLLDGSMTLTFDGPTNFFIASSSGEDVARSGSITISYIIS